MVIKVNGQSMVVDEGATVEEILALTGYDPRRVAVWVDGEQVWQKEYKLHILSDLDEVRIVRALAGG